MMKRLTKILALGLVLILITTLLAGCFKKQSKTDPSPTPTSYITQELIDPAKSYRSELWGYRHHSDYEAILREQIAQFNQQWPNIHIDYRLFSWDEGATTFAQALQAGSPPDIYQGQLDPKYLSSQLLMPINGFLTQEDLSDLEPTALQQFKSDDEYYGFPMWVSMHTWVGNRALLEQAGIDWRRIQQEGWTFDEFIATTQKLTTTNNGHGSAQWGFVTDIKNRTSETLEQLMKSAGFFHIADVAGNYMWTGQMAVETVDLFTQLIQDRSMPANAADIDTKTRDDMFWNWEAAIIGRAGPYMLTTQATRKQAIADNKLRPHPKGEAEVVLLPFPHHKGANEWAFVASTAQMVFRREGDAYKGDDHTAAAMAFAKHLIGDLGGFHPTRLMVIPSRKSVQHQWATIPAQYRSMLPTGPLNYQTDPNAQFMVRFAQSGSMPIIVDPKYSQALDQLLKQSIEVHFPAVIKGDMSAQQFIVQVTQDAKTFGLR